MNRLTHPLTALCCGLFALGGQALAADKVAPRSTTFGSLRAPAVESTRQQALDWLVGTGKTDAATRAAFDGIWSEERPLLERVVATFALGDPAAASLVADARDPQTSPPAAVPALLTEAGRKPAFYRANLSLAYARLLSERRVYEEALETLQGVRAEQVVDPAGYFFIRAVAQHALMLRHEADDSIVRLLDDVPDAPERYKMLATLMHYEMQTWKTKDLAWISRKMDNIERRLGHGRGGPTTQKLEKEVVMRLDELIKEKENQKKRDGDGPGTPGNNDGNCPPGDDPGGKKPNPNPQSSRPQEQSEVGNGTGPGHVDPVVFKNLAENWGKLPERERAKALLDLTRDMPPRFREQIESYFKRIDCTSDSKR